MISALALTGQGLFLFVGRFFAASDGVRYHSSDTEGDMSAHGSRSRFRQSVALPSELVDEVRRLAAPELRENLNGIVVVALQEFAARRRREEFAAEMAKMASDESVLRESHQITEDFRRAEADGFADHDRAR